MTYYVYYVYTIVCTCTGPTCVREEYLLYDTHAPCDMHARTPIAQVTEEGVSCQVHI